MANFVDNGNCFVCGDKNPLGLRLRFRPDPEANGVEADVVFPDHFQGWEKVVHGGLIATVLDEMLIKAAAEKGHECITAEITVKYLAPVRAGASYKIRGRLVAERGKLVYAESRLLDENGRSCARASGTLYKTAAMVKE